MPERCSLGEYIGLMKRWEKRTYLVGRAFFAVLHRGGVVVPVDPSSPPDLVGKIVERTKPVHFIGPISRDSLGKAGAGIEGTPFSALMEYADYTPGTPETVSQEDLAEVVFTSGTTGNPKGVMLTHGNILANLKPIDDGIEKRLLLVRILTPFRILCTVPYSHMFGQISGIFLPILIGSTIFYTHDTGPASLVRALRRNRAITLITVPRVMKLLKDHFLSWLEAHNRKEGFQRRWDRWVKLPYPLRVPFYIDIHRFFGLHFWSFIVGGAPLDPDTHEFWRRLVYAVFQGYGLTETSPIVTMFNPFKDNRSSVGRVFPNQEVKVSEEGEILVRGKNVMAGYFENPEETVSVLHNGWLSTGDIGTVDSEGQLFIRGRKKDMIVTSDGHNVFTQDVEEVLGRIGGVRGCCVFGMPGDAGETVHATLLLDEGTDPDIVVKKANGELLPFQRIRGYTVWEDPDFPRTPTLKIRRAEVVSRIQLQKRSGKNKNLLEGLVPGRVDQDSRILEDLGLDSLDRTELVLRLEREYGTSLDESSFGPGTTVRDLLKLAEHPKQLAALKMPRWTSSKAANLFRAIIMEGFILQLARVFCRIEAEGLEYLETVKGERIIVSNHQSHIDPFAILLALPGRYRRLLSPAMGLNRFGTHFADFSSKPTGKKSRLRGFLHGLAYSIVTLLFQTYPFPQGAAYRPSLEYTGDLLDRGHWILLFPEGEVSPDGTIHTFKKGIAMIAEQTGTDLFPVSIDGMYNVLPPGRRFPRRGQVRVRFGAPLRYKGEGYGEFTRKVENAVRSL